MKHKGLEHACFLMALIFLFFWTSGENTQNSRPPLDLSVSTGPEHQALNQALQESALTDGQVKQLIGHRLNVTFHRYRHGQTLTDLTKDPDFVWAHMTVD